MIIPLGGDQLIPEKRAQIIRLPKEEPKLEAWRESANLEGNNRCPCEQWPSNLWPKNYCRHRSNRHRSHRRQVSFRFAVPKRSRDFRSALKSMTAPDAELSGGAYTGTGAREDLGQAVTDRNGNYIFRFTRSIGEFIEESNVDVGPTEDEVVQSMPDLIAKLLDATAARRSSFRERALLERAGAQAHRPLLPETGAEQVAREAETFKALGAIRLGIASTVFDADGRITCTDTSLPDVPQARCAAWVRQGSSLRLLHRQCHPRDAVHDPPPAQDCAGFDAWEFYQEGMASPEDELPVTLQPDWSFRPDARGGRTANPRCWRRPTTISNKTSSGRHPTGSSKP